MPAERKNNFQLLPKEIHQTLSFKGLTQSRHFASVVRVEKSSKQLANITLHKKSYKRLHVGTSRHMSLSHRVSGFRTSSRATCVGGFCWKLLGDDIKHFHESIYFLSARKALLSVEVEHRNTCK